MVRKLFVRLDEEQYAKLRRLCGMPAAAPPRPHERPGRPVLLELAPATFEALLLLTLRAGHSSGTQGQYRMTVSELISAAPNRALGPKTYSALVTALVESATQRQRLAR